MLIKGNKCTTSYNTANSNFVGIETDGTGDLITQNVAIGNSSVDYRLNCPSDVTYNTSTNGFPASYLLFGTGCHTVNNN